MKSNGMLHPRSNKGVVYLEALIALPLFLLFVLSIIQIALMWQAKISARYAVFTAARSLCVTGADVSLAERAVHFVLAPVMPGISAVLSDVGSVPGEISRTISRELSRLMRTNLSQAMGGFIRSSARTLAERITSSLFPGMGISVPLPLNFEVNIPAERVIPFSWVERAVDDVVSPLAERVSGEVSRVLTANVPGRKYARFFEKYLTARYFTKLEVLNPAGEETSGPFRRGDLLRVRLHVFYPLVIPGARVLLGGKPDGLPRNTVADLVERSRAGYFFHITVETLVRVEDVQGRS